MENWGRDLMTASAAGAVETNLAKTYNIDRQASWSDLTQGEETPSFMSHDITQRKHDRAHLSLVQIRSLWLTWWQPAGLSLWSCPSTRWWPKKKKKKVLSAPNIRGRLCFSAGSTLCPGVSLFHRRGDSGCLISPDLCLKRQMELLVTPGLHGNDFNKNLCVADEIIHFRSEFLFARVSICDFYDQHQQIPWYQWIATDQVVRCHGDYLFGFRIVTSTSSTF